MEQIEITIDYLIENDNLAYRLKLSPFEYFDNNYIDKEDEFKDMIPLFDHAIEYIDMLHRPHVRFTRLLVHYDDIKEEKITHYWYNTDNFIIESLNFCNNTKANHEIIIQTCKKEKHFEVLRFVKKADYFVPKHHSIYFTDENGDQVEKLLFDFPKVKETKSVSDILEDHSNIRDGLKSK